MENQNAASSSGVHKRSADWTPAELGYAIAMFVTAGGLLALAMWHTGDFLPIHQPGVALFFLCYGLFTISMGYRHPNSAYYSFDRVAQVASILVMGPVAAALVNGMASLLYPLHRLWRGRSVTDVATASLNNGGLMALIVLVSGLVYTALGGEVPLTTLDAGMVMALLALVVTMQVLNDLGYAGLMRVRQQGKRSDTPFLNLFSIALELGSAVTAVLVAIVFNVMPVEVFVLLLLVLSLGMLALRQFANMRYKLELLVDERTRSLREKTLELERQATQDKLTGLYNRRYADNWLDQQIDRARRYRQHLTIALADLDGFKQINDLHSHAAGDEVLRRVAAIFRERCRKSDIVARYGGEEFLICFPETDIRKARVICEELRVAVEMETWTALGLQGRVTVSFGLAERRSDSSRQSLLSAADLRLYAAKNNGRNQVIA
jgi:diguanylate cyclase (GGDEF)-like protein